MRRFLPLIILTCLLAALTSVKAFAAFNQQPDNEIDSLGYYYAITGGKFPNGQTVNGDNASGGTFRYILDDPAWGYSLNVWNKDDWFPENASLALTMKNSGTFVYDNFNNEDGDFYTTPSGQASKDTPGLYRGYCMSNNYDWIYSGYFKLAEETTVDEIIGYFDANSGFDPDSSSIKYRMNIWSNSTDDLLPAVASFTGDLFSTDYAAGSFFWGDTGIDRVFGDDYDNITDDILYLTFSLEEPITLGAGEYWFSHDATVVPIPAAVWLLGCGLIGLVGVRRKFRN